MMPEKIYYNNSIKTFRHVLQDPNIQLLNTIVLCQMTFYCEIKRLNENPPNMLFQYLLPGAVTNQTEITV